MDIKGQIVIVTGGASGLGASAARQLAAAGGKVAVFDANEEAGTMIAQEIGGFFARVDITDYAKVAEALFAAEEALGVPRILVNCAGITPTGRTVGDDGTPLSLENMRRNVEVNLYGTMYPLTLFAARLAREEPLGEERGVVVNTASIAAFDGQVGQMAYAAAKGGVVGLTLPAARDLARHAIRVVTIAPGMFRTAMVGMLSEEGKDRLGAQVPFPNRLGRPEEYAHLVASIIANPMLNGEVIRLDGAHRLRA
ncbi:SDR family NAD(P)-dependent oxidoreductase [Sphingobium tyrosinilyticum]|uniref:SDR family NAD(P)-dependent oxidoreductase n=1 Tax=Sphingobium tyrosinilyticum TaxID=2715436 RepID=A0ABV9F463_9SPHN